MQNDHIPPPSPPAEYAGITIWETYLLTDLLARHAIEMEAKAEVGYDGMVIKQEPETSSFHLTDAAAAARYLVFAAHDLEITVRTWRDYAFVPSVRGQKRAHDGTCIEKGEQANRTQPYSISFQTTSLPRSTSPYDSVFSYPKPAASCLTSPQQDAEDDDDDDDDEEKEWEVTAILSSARIPSRNMLQPSSITYKVLWKGYTEPTWEPAAFVYSGYSSLLKQFHAAHPEMPGRTEEIEFVRSRM